MGHSPAHGTETGLGSGSQALGSPASQAGRADCSSRSGERSLGRGPGSAGLGGDGQELGPELQVWRAGWASVTAATRCPSLRRLKQGRVVGLKA